MTILAPHSWRIKKHILTYKSGLSSVLEQWPAQLALSERLMMLSTMRICKLPTPRLCKMSFGTQIAKCLMIFTLIKTAKRSLMVTLAIWISGLYSSMCLIQMMRDLNFLLRNSFLLRLACWQITVFVVSQLMTHTTALVTTTGLAQSGWTSISWLSRVCTNTVLMNRLRQISDHKFSKLTLTCARA